MELLEFLTSSFRRLRSLDWGKRAALGAGLMLAGVVVWEALVELGR